MRFPAYFLLLATAALGANVGDSYRAIIAEKGAPKSEMDAGPVRILGYPDMTVKLRGDVVVSIKPVAAQRVATTASPSTGNDAATQGPIGALTKRLDDAVAQVIKIVNQPVPHVPATPEMRLGYGLFHPGAERPDFNNVDVRQTQQHLFDADPLISWEGRPDMAWVGKDIEFNSATKYFYQDRSLPKKKLSTDEMLEINRLYRIIGQCEQQLAQLGYTGKVP